MTKRKARSPGNLTQDTMITTLEDLADTLIDEIRRTPNVEQAYMERGRGPEKGPSHYTFAMTIKFDDLDPFSPSEARLSVSVWPHRKKARVIMTTPLEELGSEVVPVDVWGGYLTLRSVRQLVDVATGMVDKIWQEDQYAVRFSANQQLRKLAKKYPQLAPYIRQAVPFETVTPNKVASSCPLTSHYGGLPASGGFGSWMEYEIGAARIAEATHCILGSISKLYAGSGSDPLKNIMYERAHFKEELGIITSDASEYSRDLYIKQIASYLREGEPLEEYVFKMIESVQKKAPALKRTAMKMKGSVRYKEEIPGEILLTINACYDLVIKLADAMINSLTALERLIKEGRTSETELVASMPNAYQHLQQSGTIRRLEGAVNDLLALSRD